MWTCNYIIGSELWHRALCQHILNSTDTSEIHAQETKPLYFESLFLLDSEIFAFYKIPHSLCFHTFEEWVFGSGDPHEPSDHWPEKRHGSGIPLYPYFLSLRTLWEYKWPFSCLGRRDWSPSRKQTNKKTWQLKIFSFLSLFDHGETATSTLSIGEQFSTSQHGKQEGRELETWIGIMASIPMESYVHGTYCNPSNVPADSPFLSAKSEPFLHNIKLSQQRWPGQHLLFSLPATISEKGQSGACQSLELDTN